MEKAKTYKWELRKGSKKEICPKCGRRRFVPYVLASDGETMAGPEYGRCDRENNCGYHRYPNGVEKEGGDPIERPQLEPLRFYPAAVQTSTDTPLFYYACRLLKASRVMEAWKRYRVGADGNRAIFWQIDRAGNVRAGKSIPYTEDGHRDKTDPYPASWLHKAPRWNGWHTGDELQQCFFGEHLLKEDPGAKVVIVESEKTALLLSTLSPLVFLASGGAQGLQNETKNAALEGREVLLVPDHGQYWRWHAIARAHGWQCLDAVERYPLFEGCDVWDIVEMEIKSKNAK